MKVPWMLAAAAAIASSAQAATLQFDLDTVFSGSTAASGFVRMVFADVNATTVKLTISAEWVAPMSGQYARSVYFNFNPAAGFDPTQVTFAFVGGSSTGPSGTVSKGTDSFQADGDGKYDFLIDYPTSGAGGGAARFTSGEVSVYTLTRATGLSVGDFDFDSLPAGGHGPFRAASHIQGFGDSAWMSPGPVIPLPSGAALAGLGLMVVPAIRRRPLQA